MLRKSPLFSADMAAGLGCWAGLLGWAAGLYSTFRNIHTKNVHMNVVVDKARPLLRGDFTIGIFFSLKIIIKLLQLSML